jgi:hypothetical protein
MRFSRRHPSHISIPPAVVLLSALVLALLAVVPTAIAQNSPSRESQPEALKDLRTAVAAEFQANQTDKSIWMYRDTDKTTGKNAVYHTIETREGTLRRMIELNGQPVTGSAEQAETQRIESYVQDTAAQQKERHNSSHDDAQAAELLKMLPEAFIWTIASENSEFITLDFRPNPQFDPPDMQSRVMGQMGGQLIIARNGNRIRTLRGKLLNDILIGWGILGKLYKGGTFDVERRMVGDGHWQITETDVHISGHALIFKSIGQQEDEVKTDWQPSTADTLEQAAELLGAGK